jgi:putative ABC transport system ATP-binding protein
MLVLGIDAACAPRNVGIAAARWDGAGCTVHSVETGRGKQAMRTLVPRILELMADEPHGLVAIDAPLGFPDPMRCLRDHTAGDDPPAGCAVEDPFVRRTDSFVRNQTGKVPLAVGADRIARTTLATLWFRRRTARPGRRGGRGARGATRRLDAIHLARQSARPGQPPRMTSAAPSPPPPATDVPVLEARGVFRFRAVDGQQLPIVRDVSFALRQGEFATIMGPSGSGKSTLLHVLAGLDRPSAGQVLLSGTDVGGGDEEFRARLRRERIGFIFQFFHLLPDLTVEENVTLPLRIAGQSPRAHRARIDSLLGLLGVAKLCKRLPSALSGGEMQRVSIARALATQPALVLADEPTGNLSSKAGEEVIALLREVNGRLGTTILLVTHNPRDAAAGDRILFLHDGALLRDAELTGGPFVVADVFRRLQELGI